MDILYRSEKLRKLLTSHSELTKKFGAENAKLILVRQTQMRGAEHLFEFSNLTPRPRCHALKKRRRDFSGVFAVSLDGGLRLLFEPAEDPLPLNPDGSLIWEQICSVSIIGVEDYHD